MNAVIIDDEDNARIGLELLLKKTSPEITIVGSYGTLKEAKLGIEKLNPDIVFLDVLMPQESGLNLWKYFPHPTFHVVFTTAHTQYAIQAIRLSALDYLLKPIDPNELKLVIEKIHWQAREKKIDQRLSVLEANLKEITENSKIVLPTHDSLIVVNVADIIRCQSDDVYTHIYLKDGTHYLISKILKEYEKMLPKSLFLRVHHSHIINLNLIKRYIKGITSVELVDGSIVPVSKERKERLIEIVFKVK
jgi:two-component system, LytTR family, response regulator